MVVVVLVVTGAVGVTVQHLGDSPAVPLEGRPWHDH